MTPQDWLEQARADAMRRGLEGSLALLEAFARAMRVLRAAAWNDSAGPPADAVEPPS